MKQNSTTAVVLWRAGLAAGLLILAPFKTSNAKTTYGLKNASCTGWGAGLCTGDNAAERFGYSSTYGNYSCIWTDATPPPIKGVTASFYWAGYGAGTLPVITLNGTNMNAGLSIPSVPVCGTGNGITQTASFPLSAYNVGASNTIIFSDPSSAYIILSTYTGTNLGTDVQVLITLNTGSSISTPTAGGFTNATAPLISWVPFPSATSYQLQIDTVPFFNDGGVGGALITQTINGTTGYILSGTAPQLLTNAVTYYGRVQALNGPATGVWSYISDFTVDNTAPPAPTLNSPINGVATPTQTPTFNWTAVVLP